MSKQYHQFHLVNPSPWPYVGSMSALTMLVGAVMWFHMYNYGGAVALLGLTSLVATMTIWWRDIIREGTFEGAHTFTVQKGLKYGVIFFIVSEIMIFFSFFWAFFWASLSPVVELGAVWPPVGITTLDAWSVPLLNTAVLLASGCTVTWSHEAIISGLRKDALQGLFLTIVLGIIFTVLQGMEYLEAPFTLADGAYGTVFFTTTGLHGFHVIIGTIFLTVCFFRLLNHQFTRHHHFGFEAAALYWHFVDVVWLFVFTMYYWWAA